MGLPEETAPHLFVVRVWTDPALEPPGISRGLIEDARTRERRYFRTLAELQTLIAQSIGDPGGASTTNDRA